MLQRGSRNSLQDTIDKGHFIKDKHYSSPKRVSKDIREEEEVTWSDDIEVQSDRKHIYVSINGIKIYEINELKDRAR